MAFIFPNQAIFFDQKLLEQIKQTDSCSNEAFQQIYEDFSRKQRDRKDGIEQCMDLNVLLCAAVHKNNVKLVMKIVKRCELDEHSKFLPLITAVQDFNYDMVSFLCKCYPDMDPDARGFGVFNGEVLLLNKETSALEIALKHDKEKLLKIMAENLRGELPDLHEMAQHHKAKMCRRIIRYTFDGVCDHPKPRCSLPDILNVKFRGNDPRLFDRLMAISMCPNGRLTGLQQASAVRLWVTLKEHLELNMRNQIFITDKFLADVNKLWRSMKSNDQYCYQTFVENTDTLLTGYEELNLHACLVLDSFRMLLCANIHVNREDVFEEVRNKKDRLKINQKFTADEHKKFVTGPLKFWRTLRNLFKKAMDGSLQGMNHGSVGSDSSGEEL